MKALHSKTILSQRNTVPNARRAGKHIKKLFTAGLQKQSTIEKRKKTQEEIQISDGLAICLFGFSAQAQNQQMEGSKQVSPQLDFQKQLNMYDLAYEEELRQQTVMAVSLNLVAQATAENRLQEVLPDAEMWVIQNEQSSNLIILF